MLPHTKDRFFSYKVAAILLSFIPDANCDNEFKAFKQH